MSSKKKIDSIDHPGPTTQQSVMLPKWFTFIFTILAFLLYANTLNHDYTQDDAIVIYDNMYTTKGISGISGLLSKDTFFGFFKEEGKANLVAGGRYRPLTPIMFALEYQLFGKKPLYGHLFNILWYAFLGIVIFKVLILIFGKEINQLTIATIATALFMTHPVHTEAVANIKGRDEIMALLGAVSALYFTLKWSDTNQSKYGILSAICFFCGLLSKENTSTYLAIIPLVLILFREKPLKDHITKSIPLALAFIAFMIIRTSILGWDTGGTPQEMMNNPYIKVVGNSYVDFSASEKLSTIVFTLGKYIQLLLAPITLTHDYYPRHIGIMNFGNGMVLLSLFIYVLIIGLGIYLFKKNKIVAFSLLYFIITLSIVSNIFFPIGTNMSERFIFMPSLGFTILLAYIFTKISLNNKTILYALTGIFVLAYSVKTVSRNTAWKDDFTLFTTDVQTSKNSAKILNAAGGALVTESAKEKDETKKKKMLAEAEVYLSKAITIHPNYKNAHLLLGNARFYLNKKEEAAISYEKALKLDPEFIDAKQNLGVCYRDIGRKYGEEKKDYAASQKYLLLSHKLNPGDVETINYLGITYGMQGNTEEAIKYFMLATQKDPNSPGAYENLSFALTNAGRKQEAQKMFEKAQQLKIQQKK